jgi:hypothetical protein
MQGKMGSCGVSANEYSCAHGAQINFGDLTPYLKYALDKKNQPNHFAGSFKLAENKNYEKYQQELGVSWIKMKMGALLTPMEKIRLVFSNS